MTSSEFLNLFNINKDYKTYNDILEVNEDVSVAQRKNLNITFLGKIIFHKKVKFQGVNIVFHDVKFKEEIIVDSLSKLTFEKCKATSILISNGKIELEILSGSIDYLECSKARINFAYFKDLEINRFQTNDSTFDELTFVGTQESKPIIKNILIQNGKITTLNLKNVKIGQVQLPNSKFEIISGCFETSSTIVALNFNNVEILDIAKINGNVSSLIFNEKPKFHKLILDGEITNVNFNNEVIIKSLELKGKIHHIKFIEGCKIDDCKSSCIFVDDYEISGGTIKYLKLDKGLVGSECFISGGKIEELLIESKALTILKIKPNQKIEIQKILQTVFVEHLIENVNDLLKIGKIEFSNFTIPKDKESKYIGLSINELKFIKCSNYGNIVFSHLRPWHKSKAKLVIENSDLGKMLFMDCDFNEFQMQFASSKISEIFLAGSNMPKNENINANSTSISNHDQKRLALTQIKKIYENRGDLFNATRYHEAELLDWLVESDPNNFEQKKIIYSQLKKMFEVRGDTVNVIKYHGLELDMQRSIIKNNKGFLWEKSQLWLNKNSNNFGQSWQWALGYLLIINLVFYSFYLCSLGLLFQNTDIDNNLFGYYFEFLNPTHKIDFIKNNEGLSKMKINGCAIFFDFFNRIFVGFLIYQLISAFRKYGKK